MRCAKCLKIFVVIPEGGRAAEKKPGNWTLPRSDGSGTVLVSMFDREARRMISDFLTSETRFKVVECSEGRETLDEIRRLKPSAVVLDVAIPGFLSFQITEEVRKDRDLDNVKIILVASIYDKTRYKRTPKQLYGADDYIEKHHITDSLVPKINRLINRVEVLREARAVAEEAAVKSVPAAERRKDAEEERILRKAGADGMGPLEIEDEEDPAEAIMSLARNIVSDVVLYNEDRVLDGLKTGRIYEMLAEEIGEAREIFAAKLPPGDRFDPRILDAAFDLFFEYKKKEWGIG